MLKKYILIFFTILMLNSCIEGVSVLTIASSYHSAKKSVKNTIITSKILNKLHSDDNSYKFSNLHINVDKKRVLLSGRVKKPADLIAAQELIWQVKGVNEVINEVVISNKARNYFSDSLLASKVKTKLALDKNVASGDINVETYNKVVFLFGTVQRESLVKQASIITSKVAGVKEVISHLRVAD